jgi:Mg2+ and Co2+ transporter CorA
MLRKKFSFLRKEDQYTYDNMDDFVSKISKQVEKSDIHWCDFEYPNRQDLWQIQILFSLSNEIMEDIVKEEVGKEETSEQFSNAFYMSFQNVDEKFTYFVFTQDYLITIRNHTKMHENVSWNLKSTNLHQTPSSAWVLYLFIKCMKRSLTIVIFEEYRGEIEKTLTILEPLDDRILTEAKMRGLLQEMGEYKKNLIENRPFH